jgi:hypothetical protein
MSEQRIYLAMYEEAGENTLSCLNDPDTGLLIEGPSEEAVISRILECEGRLSNTGPIVICRRMNFHNPFDINGERFYRRICGNCGARFGEHAYWVDYCPNESGKADRFNKNSTFVVKEGP